MELKDLIKFHRKKMKLTQEQLAEKMFTTYQAISNYETGYRTPDWETIKLLKKVLNISLDQNEGENTMKTKPFFTKEDFINFCGKWEWQMAGYDVDFSHMEETKEGLVYFIPQEESESYRFILKNGHILWEHENWNEGFVTRFQGLLQEFTDRKIYEKPQTYRVTVDYYEDEKPEFLVSGYSEDSTDDILMWTLIEMVKNGYESMIDEESCQIETLKKAV